MQIEITEVRTNAERSAFIKFPWKIYRDDPAWVPPLIIERKGFLDRKHPFYEFGDAALFLARRAGEIVGRIMASDDPNYNAEHQSNVGCFGMFESIDDAEVAAALFDAASNWLRARGRDEIMGPIEYSTNYACGLLIDGFEAPPMILMTHNPRYYPALHEACGFTKAMDLFAWWFDDPADAVRRLRRLAKRFENRQVATIRQVDLSRKGIASDSQRLRQIYNAAWEKNWGYVPFTEKEFLHMAKELRPIADKELTLVAEVDGEPVGFVLGMPDINAALRHANGRLTKFGLPIGLAKLLYYKARIKTARLVALGVVPKYRRHGVAEMLVLRVIESGMLKRGIVGELSMILENNHLMNRFNAAIGARKYKTYRIYQRTLHA